MYSPLAYRSAIPRTENANQEIAWFLINYLSKWSFRDNYPGRAVQKEPARRIKKKDRKGIDYLSVRAARVKGENKRHAFTVRPWRVNRCDVKYLSTRGRTSLMRANSDKQVMLEFMLVGRPQIQHHPIFKSANIQVRQFQTLSTRTIVSVSLYGLSSFIQSQTSVCSFRRATFRRDIVYNTQSHSNIDLLTTVFLNKMW